MKWQNTPESKNIDDRRGEERTFDEEVVELLNDEASHERRLDDLRARRDPSLYNTLKNEASSIIDRIAKAIGVKPDPDLTGLVPIHGKNYSGEPEPTPPTAAHRANGLKL